MSERHPRLAASLLCADAMRLEDDLRALESARIDYIHVDMADGHFVPSLGIGFDLAKQVKSATSIQLDVHLIVANPEDWVARVLNELSPAMVVFHAEATSHGVRLAQDKDHMILAHLAGKLRRNRIRVLAGGQVTLEMSPYDLTKGRITYRHK